MYMFGYEEDSSVVDLAKQYSKYKDNIKTVRKVGYKFEYEEK